jgi:hypothetical protein
MLFLGRWRNTPKAWATGEPEPWPTQQQLREQRDAARADREPSPPRGGGPDPPSPPPPAAPSPRRPDPAAPGTEHSASKKKKRKRRS